MCIEEEEDTPTRKRVTWSESFEHGGLKQRRLIFLYLCIGEEEDTPTRKWVTCGESLEQKQGAVEADISVLVYR